MADETSNILVDFSYLDYAVFCLMLVISLLIGVYFSKRGNKNAEDYLLGGRCMSPYPVSASLLSSFVSAISLLGIPGEGYAHGIQQSFMIIGTIFGLAFAAFICVPIFYNIDITSINEYIEKRFRCKYLHKAMFALNAMNLLFYTGVCLYAPTLALSSVTTLNYQTFIVILGVICTIYSTIGGLKAVVWTDVFQMGVMLLGLFVIMVIGTVEAGGFYKVLDIAYEGHRMEVFNLDIHPHVRHNMVNVIIQGAFMWGAVYGTSQTNLQRICSVRSEKDAKLVIFLNLIGMTIMWVLLFYCGICAYAVYRDCDPMALGHIDTQDQILPYMVMDKVKSYGIPGLFVAAMFSGALSSLSSVINALVAMVWTDILKKWRFFRDASEVTSMLVNKMLSAVIGGIMIGMAFIASRLGTVMQAGMTISGAFSGPSFGIFILGIAFPRVKKTGAWAGLVVSACVMMWISMGSFLFSPRPTLLPQSTEGCPVPVNSTLLNSTYLETPMPTVESNYTLAETKSEDVMFEETGEESFAMIFYKISYTLFLLMGSGLCIIIALITTCITGGNNPDNVPDELLMTCIRKNKPVVVTAKFVPVPTCNCQCQCTKNFINYNLDAVKFKNNEDRKSIYYENQ